MAGLFVKQEHELQNHLKLQDPNTSSLSKIQVDSIFIEQPAMS